MNLPPSIDPLSGVPAHDIAAVRPLRASALIAWAAAGSLALYALQALWPQLGWLAWPLLWLSTLFHELGHGLAAIAMGGEVRQLAVYADGSGVAAHAGVYSGLQRAFIAAAGPLGAPIAGLALFLSLGHRLAARVLLLALGLLLALVLLLWVRNAFGVLIVGSVAALALLVALRAGEKLLYLITAFIAVEMSLSSLGRLDTLFSATASTGGGELASDSAQIASALYLPYWFWGGLLAGASILIVVAGFVQALRLGAASPRPT